MTRAARKYTITIPAFGAVQLLASGSLYKIVDATGEVNVTRGEGSTINDMLPGQGERTEFSRLVFEDASGAPNTVIVLVADNSFIDDRLIGTIAVTAQPRASVVNSNKTVTNASATLVAANGTRKYLLIQNNGSGYISVRLDGGVATAATGIRIAAGGGALEFAGVLPVGEVTAIGSIASNPDIVVVEG